MLFVSFTFAFFLPLVVLLRWVLPDKLRAPWLLVSSYVFYLSWGPVYGLLLGGATVFSFFIATAMERWPNRKRLSLSLGIVTILAVLAYFKYAGFLVTQGWNLAKTFGYEQPMPELDIILPLGISFYLFQVLSYLVDVYRGQKAEVSLTYYALYVSFFPQLVAGPIVRGSELIPQLRGKSLFDPDRFSRGIFLILRGFFKKIVIADNLALWSDNIFTSFDGVSTLSLWVGVVAYTGQIYCDFSGYTDIARGSAMLLGYNIPENFNLPYLASNPSEFWRRWHMTLSRWLRDYLYIPLGGNRKGVARMYVALMSTMALGGLWHGADWRFVVWGIYHGILLVVHRLWVGVAKKNSRMTQMRETIAYRFASVIITFTLVAWGWILFRAQSFSDALSIFLGLFKYVPHGETPDEMKIAYLALLAILLEHVLGQFEFTKTTYEKLPAFARGIAWGAVVVGLFFCSSSTSAFIYFQF